MSSVQPVAFFHPPSRPNGGTVYLDPSRSVGQEEDEVLLAWLCANVASLPTAEKRAAVQRLCDEFGYTTRGLSELLGLSQSTIRYLRASEESLAKERRRARRLPRVPTTRVLRLVDAWQERIAGGLSAEEAGRLLDELRALAPDQTSSTSSPPNPKGLRS